MQKLAFAVCVLLLLCACPSDSSDGDADVRDADAADVGRDVVQDVPGDTAPDAGDDADVADVDAAGDVDASKDPDVADAPDGDTADVDAGPEGLTTQSVYERLLPTCVGCHLAQATVPSFGSFQQFEALIAYNPDVVTPGDPEGSELTALLEGRGTGQYAQMPIGERTFLELTAAGQTEITVEEVKAWIAGLEGGPTEYEDDSRLHRRLSARQIQRTLYEQLGLDDSDWFNIGPEQVGYHPRERFPMRDPLAIPASHPNSGLIAERRWAEMGGSNYHIGRRSNLELAPTFALTLTGVAQAWCRMSVNKPDNDALFRHATRSDTSESNPQAIRDNLGYLWLRMLGVVATPEDIDGLYEDVFLVYEARSGTRAAWVGVCATLVRDPLWVTY